MLPSLILTLGMRDACSMQAPCLFIYCPTLHLFYIHLAVSGIDDICPGLCHKYQTKSVAVGLLTCMPRTQGPGVAALCNAAFLARAAHMPCSPMLAGVVRLLALQEGVQYHARAPGSQAAVCTASWADVLISMHPLRSSLSILLDMHLSAATCRSPQSLCSMRTACGCAWFKAFMSLCHPPQHGVCGSVRLLTSTANGNAHVLHQRPTGPISAYDAQAQQSHVQPR